MAKKPSLRARIKAAAAGTDPGIPAPPEKEEEVPPISDLIHDRKARLELARLVDKRGQIGEQIATLRKEEKPLTAAIKKLAGTYGVGKALVGEWRLNYFSGERWSLSTEKLLANGVTQEQIDNSWTSKPSYTLKISRQGEEEDSNGDNEE